LRCIFIRPGRVLRTAIVLRPSTILACHRALVHLKYRWLFSPKRRGRPGPRGPSAELVAAIVEMKRHNPRWGCPRIAQQIAVERLIGTFRREYLNRMPFWGAADHWRKPADFQAFYNTHRAHSALGGQTPARYAGAPASAAISLQRFAWQSHCRGLFQTPMAA
jgi:transposase InsO family protein